MPGALGTGKGSSSGDVVDVRMIVEGAPPGVKDAEVPRQVAAHVLLIGGKLPQAFGGSFEHGGIGPALIGSDEAAQRLRDREGDEEMMAGQLSLQLLFKPGSGLLMLTGRAMAIAAGAVHEVGLPALLATVERSATRFGAAFADGLYRFAMLKGNGLTIALQIVGAEGAKDVVDVFHATAPPSPG